MSACGDPNRSKEPIGPLYLYLIGRLISVWFLESGADPQPRECCGGPSPRCDATRRFQAFASHVDARGRYVAEAVCPGKACAQMRAELGHDAINPELMSVKKKADFFSKNTNAGPPGQKK